MFGRKGKGGGGGMVKERALEVGVCLKVAAELPEGVGVVVVLDSGAGVSIVGERFMKKWKEKYGEMEVREVDLRVTGVYSGAPLTVKGVTTFPLLFKGASTPTLVTAVVVPEWSGELLLGWRTLRNLGIRLTYDNPGKPAVVKLSKIGVEMEAMEAPQNDEILAAEALGLSVDKEMRKLEKKYENRMRRELRRRNKEKLTRAKREKETARGYSLGEGDGGQHKRRKVDEREAIHRGRQARRWSKEQWKERCHRRGEKTKEKAAQAVARILSLGANPADGDPAAGWAVADEGIIPLRARGWDKPTLLAGRRAGKAVIEFIREGKTGTVLFPLTDVTAGHVLEALDKTDDIPILIPAVHMYRMEGNVAVKQDWVAMRIAKPEEAETWRARTRKAFREMKEKEIKEMICEMEGGRLLRLKPEEVELSSESPTVLPTGPTRTEGQRGERPKI